MSAATVPSAETEFEQANAGPIEHLQEAQAQVPEKEAEVKEEMVPLSALQKERRKRQDLEQQLSYERETRVPVQPQEEDESLHEPLTRKDISYLRQEVRRDVLESDWLSKNSDKKQEILDKLPELLNKRPHLVNAINAAPNRWEEASELLSTFNYKEQVPLKAAPGNKVKSQTQTPGSPSSVPKGAAMNASLDVMGMSDEEYSSWRKARKKK